jgi:hypothetical protein
VGSVTHAEEDGRAHIALGQQRREHLAPLQATCPYLYEIVYKYTSFLGFPGARTVSLQSPRTAGKRTLPSRTGCHLGVITEEAETVL